MINLYSSRNNSDRGETENNQENEDPYLDSEKQK